ncbi:hypothetical protein BJ508DRAFT_377792 [Ascobolus immersus RN42]|uniref:Uncharacterized protein n=1 Tax=Ascobolus immersus RN42 TaxID=1160509 RepID=A0A3N4HZL6_ASCIM|nr:hypothetical protein BJ508DRAFT_377792 [Ascobolus immersus RN42]
MCREATGKIKYTSPQTSHTLVTHQSSQTQPQPIRADTHTREVGSAGSLNDLLTAAEHDEWLDGALNGDRCGSVGVSVNVKVKRICRAIHMIELMADIYFMLQYFSYSLIICTKYWEDISKRHQRSASALEDRESEKKKQVRNSQRWFKRIGYT